jgi:hypothetical protein
LKSYYRPDFDAPQAPYRRAQRRRRFLVLARRGGVVLAFIAVIGLAAAAWASLGPGWVRARLASLRLLRIETVQVGGNRALSNAEVLAAAGLRTGESLLGLDLAAARARLTAHPRVREASLRRRLPATVVVEVTERVPCAIVRADRDYLVDAEGAILESADPGTLANLPVLTGIEVVAGALTARGATDVAAGIELVAAIRQVGFPAIAAVGHIDLTDPDDAVIVPVSGRPLVHTGRRDAAGRLQRWRSVAPDMAQRWPEFDYVDLRAEGQVVAMPTAPAPEDGAEEKPAGGENKPSSPPHGKGPGAGAGRVAAGGGHA